MIPDSFLEELKQRCDIESLISSYVLLKRAGRNLKGLCPFHSEKTPSFVVYPESQSFYCFGCGAGGDAISFIMRAENLEYIEAVKFLAEKAGLPMPENTAEDRTGKRRMRILEMNREAARFFHQCLVKGEDRRGLEYLANRGMDKKMIIRFGLAMPRTAGMPSGITSSRRVTPGKRCWMPPWSSRGGTAASTIPSGDG
ncbi:MAG: CHC2 zinc finger domain-containing protein [Acutalibacteraceae bacterium]